MSSSYANALPRAINFKETNMREFVLGNSFIKVNKQNKQTNNNSPYSLNPYPNQLPFDLYNRNNLLLHSCCRQDIQIIQKNPIVFEEDIVDKKSKKQNLQIAGAKKIPQFVKINEGGQKKSKQAQLNDFLFNYREEAKKKKDKKLQFLTDIEKKLNNLQKEVEEIEMNKEKQYENLDQIMEIHNEWGTEMQKNHLVAKIDKVLIETNEKQLQMQEPQKLNDQMEFLQINAAIENQHQFNAQFIEHVERVSRSKSKNKQKVQYHGKQMEKTGFRKGNQTSNSLNKTLKKSNMAPPRPVEKKKMATTWRTNK